MFIYRPHLCRAARVLSRGGFTLVELLVVIGIIAILAGVALGPITNGIKKAQQSAVVQSSHAIGLAMYSCAGDNSQLYPDTNNPVGNGGTGAAAPAKALLTGGYVTDPSIFYISSDTASAKYTGAVASAAGNILASNVSWDFVGGGGTGISSVTYPYLPILWTSLGQSGTVSNLNSTGAITASPMVGNAFGAAGMVVFYEGNSATYIAANSSGVVTMVSSTSNGGPASTATVLSGY